MEPQSAQRKRLGDLLLSLRLITEEQLKEALVVQRDGAELLGSILVALGFVSEDQLLKALAAQDGVSAWRLDEQRPSPEALAKVPAHICRSVQVIPVRIRGDLLTLGMRNPLDYDAIDTVRNIAAMRIEPVLVDEGRLARVIEECYTSPSRAGQIDGLVSKAMVQFDYEGVVNAATSLTEADTRPVVGLVNQVLSDAIRLGASDVHVEPRADRVEIRYRIDGLLRRVRDIPIKLLPMLTTRLKIMADMDIVEHRMPQDGRVSATIDGRSVDMRVSAIPTQHGQRLVLRILDKSRSVKAVTELGFTPEELATFRSMLRRPYGIILVTGPTGSGKTTTLYAALQDLHDGTRNIMTCEDPIEYAIDNVNQTQINEKIGLTFAAQLRATLRQDPDVILVGEIRDSETAETAIRAALTGHLVLSTLHCNDAPNAIPRLFDLGIDPFLLSTSLIGIMSQRLLRRSCRQCDGAGEPSCPSCAGTGFRGRTAVHEILPVTDDVAATIGACAAFADIKAAAYEAGYRPMQVSAERLVDAGITTDAEARRHVFYEEPEDLSPLLRAA